MTSGISEKTLKREGVCAASLPTTMGLVAAILVQNVLKSETQPALQCTDLYCERLCELLQVVEMDAGTPSVRAHLPSPLLLMPLPRPLSRSLAPSRRYTLKFGKVGYYLGYNALSDFFPTWPMRPNPVCTSSVCRQRQQQHAGWVAPEDMPEAEEKRAPVVHESNEVWPSTTATGAGASTHSRDPEGILCMRRTCWATQMAGWMVSLTRTRSLAGCPSV